jgi:PleD family two-component response regulator
MANKPNRRPLFHQLRCNVYNAEESGTIPYLKVGRHAAAGREACMQPPATNPESPTPRVLIADDNPQGAELLEAYLSACDYELRTAADGEQTLKQVADWHPDLILLDVMMPRISGFEVCKRLRANPATRDIAVLMVTALDQPSDIERAVEAGTDDFVSKPIDKNTLLLRVRSLLRSRQYKRELDRALAYIEAVERGEQ